MKRLIIFIIVFISQLYGFELHNWFHDYDKALEAAQKQNKMVYLFIGADNCRFCERYKEMTLSKKEVIDTLKKDYILLFLNRDQHSIPERFVTQGVPRHYFLSACGKIIHEDAGSREPAGLYDILDEVDLKKD